MNEIHIKEKNSVALNSVFAAVFLTISKLVVGLYTGSLGILSEALHSGLDLIAAVITYFSVRISDKPADDDHHFGHGKVENLSALIETLLLLITCIWIIYEATHRLISGNLNIEVSIWSYIVVLGSITIDFWRSRALMKAAKKFNSQALEADALHFSTDILSSGVVLLGLICAQYGFFIADSIAALGVAMIVIVVSYRIGKRAVDVLLDRTSNEKFEHINTILATCKSIESYSELKVRTSGADTFVAFNIQIGEQYSIKEAHDIANMIEKNVTESIQRCYVHIHMEPTNN